jgi:hypothetical protein
VVFDPIALFNVETAENFDLDVLSQLVKVLLKLGMIVRKDQGLHIQLAKFFFAGLKDAKHGSVE